MFMVCFNWLFRHEFRQGKRGKLIHKYGANKVDRIEKAYPWFIVTGYSVPIMLLVFLLGIIAWKVAAAISAFLFLIALIVRF